MEKTVLEKNLEQISRYNEKLAKKIAELNQLKYGFELLEAKSGDANLLYNDILLHDNIDPQEEAYNIFRSLPDNSKSTINVLFGLGLGYVFKRFALSCKGKIILLEPNLDVLRITLELVDMSEELAKDGIIVVDSIGDLETYFEKVYFAEAKVNLKYLSSYARLNPEIFSELEQKVEFIKGLYEHNYNNLFRQGVEWTAAGILNIPHVLSHYELEPLRNKFADKPAVIISAGPSLDENIDILKEYQDKAVIFCVGTALKTAVKHGIKPNFLTVVETHDCSSQAAGVDTSGMNMILMPFTHSKFHELKTKRKFNFYAKNDFTVAWLAKHLNISLDDYYSKGTVSMCALYSARILGCNPVILIGQDLAYTNGRCYSKDSAYHDLKCIKNESTGKYEIVVDNYESYLDAVQPDLKLNSTNPKEVASVKYWINTFKSTFTAQELLEYEAKTQEEQIAYINRRIGKSILKDRLANLLENMYFVKGQDGDMIPTDSGYAVFISYFEQAAREFGDKVKFINSTAKGAYLEGFEHIPLRTALNSYTKNTIDVESTIAESLKSGRNLLKSRGNNILRELNETVNLIECNIKYFEQGNIYVQKLNKEFNNKRLNTNYFKEHCQQVLSCYIAIEKNILTKNELLLGLLYPYYLKLSNYLCYNSDIINEESLKKFVDLVNYFFITGYENLLLNINVLRSTRDRLNESCNTAG